MSRTTIHSILKLSLAIAALTILAAPAGAQLVIGRGRTDAPEALVKSVRGVVHDLRGTPIPGALVFIVNLQDNVIRTATSDAQGVYAFSGLAADADYEVRAEFRGQRSASRTLSSFLARADNVINLQMDMAVLDAPADSGAATAAPAPPPIQLDTFDLVKLGASFQLPTGIPAPIPAVLLLHGYGEDRSAWTAFTQQILAQGWAVMALDLRGHGSSTMRNQQRIAPVEGWRASPREFPLDLEPALNWIKSQPRVDTNKIVVIGYDIGANLSLVAASKYREVHSAVAVHPQLNESVAMAGSGQDFHPRSALIFAANEEEGRGIAGFVQGRAAVQTATEQGGTTAMFAGGPIPQAVLQWLRDIY